VTPRCYRASNKRSTNWHHGASLHRRKETPTMNQRKSSPSLAKLKALAVRHPIALFLAVLFGFVYPLMALPILAQYGIIPGASLPAMFGMDMERAASALLIVPGLVLATVLVTALEGGQPALRGLLRRVLKWRIGLVWSLVTVIALPATTVVLAVLMGDSFRIPGADVLAAEVVQVAVAFFIINLWEETAWSGFFQSRLERRYNFFVAAALTAIPFAAIHVPLRVINGGNTPAGIAQGFVLLVILGLIFRPLIGMGLRGSGDSVMAAALMHTFFNRSNNIDGIAADLLVGANRPLAALIATVLLTSVIGFCIRRQLSRAHRLELDAMNSEILVSRGKPGTSIKHA
jgi:membrane protease YdiL (CAAX protease family)